MFKLKIDTAGLEATTLVTISYFLPLLFACFYWRPLVLVSLALIVF